MQRLRPIEVRVAADTAAAISADLSFEDAYSVWRPSCPAWSPAGRLWARSIALYEEGAKLKAHCEARLKAAQLRVEEIVVGPDGGQGRRGGVVADDDRPVVLNRVIAANSPEQAVIDRVAEVADLVTGRPGRTAAARGGPGSRLTEAMHYAVLGPRQTAAPVLRAGGRRACSTSTTGRSCAPPARWGASVPTAWFMTTCRAWTTTTCVGVARRSTAPMTRRPRCWPVMPCRPPPSRSCPLRYPSEGGHPQRTDGRAAQAAGARGMARRSDDRPPGRRRRYRRGGADAAAEDRGLVRLCLRDPADLARAKVASATP